MQLCEVEEASIGDVPGIAVSGEVDIDAVAALDRAFATAIFDSVGVFVVDLTHVTFLDSSGLATIMRARARLGRENRELAVICPPGPARRLLEVTSMDDLLATFGSRQEAAAALVPSG